MQCDGAVITETGRASALDSVDNQATTSATRFEHDMLWRVTVKKSMSAADRGPASPS